MINKISIVLNDIYNSLDKENSEFLSLMGGKAGIALFNFLYLKYKNEELENEKFQCSIQQLAEEGMGFQYTPFCGGKAGINWFFNFLYSHNILDEADWKLLSEDNRVLANSALKMLEAGNYDFLHGATGIAYQLLYTNENYSSFYDDFLKLLIALFDKSTSKSMVPYYDIEKGTIDPDKVNIGLSHGIPSLLKFSIECCKNGTCYDEAKTLAQKITGYLISQVNKDKSKCYFPCIIGKGNENNNAFSRLGWCYGDLGVGIILYQAGKILKDTKVVEFALEILHHSAKRRSLSETIVYDAGICHGSAGIAHIFNKIWHYTKEPRFKEACDFWIQKTLDFSVYKDGIAGYKKFNARDQVYEKEVGLLEGVTGIGLVLLSYLTEDFSWDYCLMLND